MDNSKNRLLDVFFYGLYMDPAILIGKGVEPRNPRKGVAKGYQLCIGKMATLLRSDKGEAHGIVYALTHEELDKLYSGSGLTAYVSEALLVETDDKRMIPVMCCNLLVPPNDDEGNPEYADKLAACMKKHDLPVPGL